MRPRPKIPHPDVAVVDQGGRMTRQWRDFMAEVSRRVPVTGTAEFAAGTTVAVAFAAPETDADYDILVEGSEDNTFWPSAKTVSGFTMNAGNTSSATVGWALLRT